MSYIYTVKNADIDKIKELGFDLLPESLIGAPNPDLIFFKVQPQPYDGECVKSLIDFYDKMADKICSDSKMRKAHALIGIKFRRKKGKYVLQINDEVLEMFSLWRLELNLMDNEYNVYFTISDGNLPRFFDAEKVIEKYCDKNDIETLVLNNIIEKIEIGQVQ